MRDDPFQLIGLTGPTGALLSMKLRKPLPPHLGHAPIAVLNDAAAVFDDQAEGVQGGHVGVIAQDHGHAALTEGLLNACHDGVVEALDLLSAGLAAEQAGDLRAVVPRLGITGRDGVLQRVRAIAEIDKRIIDRTQEDAGAGGNRRSADGGCITGALATTDIGAACTAGGGCVTAGFNAC